MTIPMWTLLGFASWTIFLLLVTVGVYRWSRIFAGRAGASEFPADNVQGKGWYKRAMRAHANCIENLPVFGAIVFVLYVTGINSSLVNFLCTMILAARIPQSLVHVCLEQTDKIALLRFGFFFIQYLGFAILIGIIVKHAVNT